MRSASDLDALEVGARFGRRADDLDAGRSGQAKCFGDAGRPARGTADDRDPVARAQRRDLRRQLDHAGSLEHGHERPAAGHDGEEFVGVEGRRRDQVVVESIEAVADLLDEGALGLRFARKRLVDPLGIVGGVGPGAFGEQDPDERTGPLPFGGRRERGRGQFLGREPGANRAPQGLGDDAAQRLLATPAGEALRDMRARAVAARDVAGLGEAAVDGPDRVRIDPQGRAKLPDRRESGPRQQPARGDLVADLPVDLGRDRHVRIAFDVEVVTFVGPGRLGGPGIRLRRLARMGC